MVVGGSPDGYVETQNTTTVTGTSQTLAANGLNQSYSYDSFGNLQSTGNYNFEQAYTSSNQLSGWSYDQAGNLLTDGLGNSYQYDADSKIKSGPGATYYYTAEGQRVEKAVGSSLTDTVYFGGRPIARLSGGAWTDLVYAGGAMLAEVPGTQAGSPTYRMTDHIGSVVGQLSSTGAALASQDLGPFGEIFAGGISDAFIFTGKERDAESGNDYFGARFYSSNMGRFMTPDWASNAEAVPYSDFSDPQSLNLYAYVRNNPISRIDADGHAAEQGNSNGWWDPNPFFQFVRDSMNGGRHVTSALSVLLEAQQQNSNADPNQPTIQGVAASGTYGSKKAAAIAAEKAGIGSTRGAAKGGKYEEFGGWVISKDGKYTYTVPVTFGSSTVFYADNVTVPSGYTAVGGYHTHPDPNQFGEGFSVPDMNWAAAHNMTSYVGMSYSGNIRSYTPGVTKYNGYGVTGDLIGNVP